MIVAGEASGDLHAAGLAAALKDRHPEWRLTGMGGARMAAAGVEMLERTDTTAVMGFVEVLRSLPHHLSLLKAFRRRLESGAVSCLVTIDYPGFNLRLAEMARAAGVPVLYYIVPQVWAWGADRLPRMARVITKAAVILPFEEELLRAHGIDAAFVGHPLLDRIAAMPDRATARAALGLPGDANVLALFPGSRQQEIDWHLEPFVRTARLLERAHPGLQVLVATAPGVIVPVERCPYRQVTESSFAALRAADAAVCKSGTTTLEAAVAGCPLVVAYRTSRWTMPSPAAWCASAHRAGQRCCRPRSGARVRAIGGASRGDGGGVVAAPDRRQPGACANERDLADVRDRLGAPGAAARVAGMAESLVA
jgi:lipid-A-disaccharide synthase